MIRVRFFAAAADAAGVDETELEGAALTVEACRAALVGRFGGEFARVLDRSSVLVGGVRVEPTALVPDGATFDVLPPFAGG